MSEPGLEALGRIRRVSIDSVRPLEGNARRGDVEVIRESIRRHGLYKPIIVRQETDEILVGNHTWQACREEGYRQIAVIYRSVPEDADAAAIAAVDNRSSDLGTYDKQALAELLQRAAPAGDFEGTGYSAGDLEQLLEPTALEPEAPATPAAPQTRTGDVIELGRHLLVCGDAREPAAIDAALDGGRPRLVITDPPYGVEIAELANMRADRTWTEMAGDAHDGQALAELHRAALELAHQRAPAGTPIYLFHADTAGELERAVFREAGWRLAQTLVWVKNTLVVGRQDYQWRHEPILYGWKPGAAHRWFGQHNRTTVLEQDQDLDELDADELRAIARALLEETPGTVLRFDKPHRSVEHPTMKPVDLIARLTRYSSEPGDVVLDPFAGSGTTILAAEQTDRTAACVELEPGYCDVIVERFEELTGTKAKRRRRRRKGKAT